MPIVLFYSIRIKSLFAVNVPSPKSSVASMQNGSEQFHRQFILRLFRTFQMFILYLAGPILLPGPPPRKTFFSQYKIPLVKSNKKCAYVQDISRQLSKQ